MKFATWSYSSLKTMNGNKTRSMGQGNVEREKKMTEKNNTWELVDYPHGKYTIGINRYTKQNLI